MYVLWLRAVEWFCPKQFTHGHLNCISSSGLFTALVCNTVPIAHSTCVLFIHSAKLLSHTTRHYTSSSIPPPCMLLQYPCASPRRRASHFGKHWLDQKPHWQHTIPPDSNFLFHVSFTMESASRYFPPKRHKVNWVYWINHAWVGIGPHAQGRRRVGLRTYHCLTPEPCGMGGLRNSIRLRFLVHLNEAGTVTIWGLL